MLWNMRFETCDLFLLRKLIETSCVVRGLNCTVYSIKSVLLQGLSSCWNKGITSKMSYPSFIY